MQVPYKRVWKLGGNKCLRSESVDGIGGAIEGLVECSFNVLLILKTVVIPIYMCVK